MNLIVWLIAGGIIGWIASLLMRTDGEQGVILNVLVGIVGAAIGGWLISPMLGFATINQGALSLGSLAVSLLGAVVLLAVVNLIRRGTTR
ncbi:MAG: GlsB/YeaQ/YmgE family stress response membrane protein [Rubrivivax sp.]|nr:MAG: GlsB/YeaQ/YmgE family stress response membrane protein [Rubrivivax sp.]